MMGLPMHPTFIIAGERRSGTTSLYHWLNAHPGVWMRPGVDSSYFVDEALGPTTWTEGAPSCLASPDRPAPVRGLTIQLEVRGKTHTYLSDMERVRPCETPRP